MLCDPDARHPLDRENGSLRNAVTGRIYPVRDDIPLFVSTVSGPNLRAKNKYDRIAPFYDAAQSFARWRSGGADHRAEAVEELAAEAGMRVLEPGIGTGWTVPMIPAGTEIFGLDVSLPMLQECQSNLTKWKREAHLFQGEACRLPFKVEVFDRILHVGGISQFSQPARALKEMLWVAKAGAKIVIVDRMDAVVRSQTMDEGERPHREIDEDLPGKWLLKMVPPEVTEIRARTVGRGKWFCVTLVKPMNHAGA